MVFVSHIQFAIVKDFPFTTHQVLEFFVPIFYIHIGVAILAQEYIGKKRLLTFLCDKYLGFETDGNHFLLDSNRSYMRFGSRDFKETATLV